MKEDVRLWELYEALKALGVAPGRRIAVRVANRTVHGEVLDVLPGYVVLKSNPEGRRILVRLRDIKYVEIEE